MQTADDVRALARRYAKKPTVPVVRLPERPAPRPAPVRVPPVIPERVRLTTHDIIRTVAFHFKIHPEDITGPSRVASIVRPRQIAVYLSRDILRRSYPEIGRRFGGRDHTTALHAANKIGRLLPVDEDLAFDVAAITERLGAE